MAKRSTDNKNSRYVWGGETDVHQNRLGWWERRTMPKSNTDVTITITTEYDRRPDLLAYDLYGSAKLATLILQYNTILDINEEFVAGKQITIPSPARVALDFLNKPTGGNRK